MENLTILSGRKGKISFTPSVFVLFDDVLACLSQVKKNTTEKDYATPLKWTWLLRNSQVQGLLSSSPSSSAPSRCGIHCETESSTVEDAMVDCCEIVGPNISWLVQVKQPQERNFLHHVEKAIKHITGLHSIGLKTPFLSLIFFHCSFFVCFVLFCFFFFFLICVWLVEEAREIVYDFPGGHYEGGFMYGWMHGKGVYTDNDGDKLEGFWDTWLRAGIGARSLNGQTTPAVWQEKGKKKNKTNKTK
jgi:hypothetical protein